MDGKRVYPCRVCGFRFSASSNRNRHERNKHAGESANEQAVAVPTQHTAASEKKEKNEHAMDVSCEDVIMEEQHDGDANEMMNESSARGDSPDSSSSSSEPLDSDMIDTPSTSDLGSEATSVSATALTELANALPHEPLGVLALMQDTHLQSECLPFLRWMCTPPITQVEALVKARRVTSMTQLQPIKLNLRFLFGLLLEAKAMETLELQALTRLTVCQALSAALEHRQVSHGRIHALFLLVKKVLVFISSQESTRRHQFLAPTMHESFLFVENVCSDSSHRRKQEARNRAVLGVQTSKTLQALNGNRSSHGASTLSLDAFTMPSMLGPASDGASRASGSAPPRTLQHTPASSSSSSSQSATSSEGESLSPNELTCDELKIVAKGALAYLQQHRETNSAVPAYYVHHLVTATLCLGLAPRSQVLKQLRIGSSFVKESDGCYKVNMLAKSNKNGKPTSFALPKVLTESFDYYLSSLRPRLLREQGQEHDFVFFKRNGTAPRVDFSDLTSMVTQQLIGRPVNPHAFRSAVITTFYETGATQSQMDVLASLMSHSSDTARAYYFKPQMVKAAVDTSNRMLHALDLSTDSAQ